MLKDMSITLLKSVILTALAVGIALGTNALRSDGIPFVAEIPYEIFAACKDAEATSVEASAKDIAGHSGTVLIVDARPTSQFATEHAEGAVNVPYSPLFGASDSDVAKMLKLAEEQKPGAIVVYGAYEDPSEPGVTVDFAKPLADQLTEAGIQNVRHASGGIEALKKEGAKVVKGK